MSSASEKLRALKETGLTCEHWTDYDASDLDLTDLLIAVVEAAEPFSASSDSPYLPAGWQRRLRAALSALEEALS